MRFAVTFARPKPLRRIVGNMRSGSDPHNNQSVESGENMMQFRAASAGYTSNEEMMRQLVMRLGGEHAVVEQLTALLEHDDSTPTAALGEEESGYCYLKLFDGVEHRDAMRMGPRPTVAELRRFSNGRANPFGLRTVTVLVRRDEAGRLAHVSYNGGRDGLRPVEALAALSKDCRVGGLPDGVTEDFPASWIPAELHAVQTWDFIRPGQTTRGLDLLEWIGNEPPWADKRYEPISASTSRVRWVVRADPLGPATGMVDVIDPAGKVISVKTWTSYVAHTGYHQTWKVRGNKVFAEATMWRAAKVLSDPTSPAPQPTPPPGHGDLLLRVARYGGGPSRADGVKVMPVVDSSTPGFCYAKAFADEADAIWTLGAYPRVRDVAGYADVLRSRNGPAADCDGMFVKCSLGGDTFKLRGNVVHHVVQGTDGDDDFWDCLALLNEDDLIGATMADATRPSDIENVNLPAALTIRPKQQGMIVNIPFVAVLKAGEENLLWDITTGKKFDGLGSHFESVELVSLSAKVTVHKGDNDTLVTLAVDTTETMFSSETDWVGAAHTLLVSGNVNGATTGEMKLEGNHGFGTQLKGVSVGNATPVVQVKLETTVAAKAYVKFILTVRVAGTGHPHATVLRGKPNKGGMNGSAGGRSAVSNDSD